MAMMATRDSLERQVGEARRTIASDGYPMSIGELTSLYRDGELIIRPEFQRLFRWTNLQKSRLIESILLGIPLPSIFVSQQKDGKWELVDGLQRVSTILQLQGELKTDEGEPYESLILEETKYLPALEGRRWDGQASEDSLSNALKLDIKRAKIDIKILKRESSQDTKFDLFQRLNSFGSTLTAQEVRSALLVGSSPDFFQWLLELSRNEAFSEVVLLSDADTSERYDLELILRFLILHAWPDERITSSSLRDFTNLLDNESLELSKSHPRSASRLRKVFSKTFEAIAANGGSAIFSRWDEKRREFRGSFLNSAFEIFALGLGYHISKGNRYRTDLPKVAQRLWKRPEMAPGFATGKSTESRLAILMPLGRQILEA
jgi:hypothetical protein